MRRLSGRPRPAEATGGWTETASWRARDSASPCPRSDLSLINTIKTSSIRIVTTTLTHLPLGGLDAFSGDPATFGLPPRGALKFKSTNYGREIVEILFPNLQTWFFVHGRTGENANLLAANTLIRTKRPLNRPKLEALRGSSSVISCFSISKY